MDEAIAQYQKALQIKPDSRALNNLAWLLATCPDARLRDGVQAVKYAEQACELTHYGVTLVGTLAAAYAEAGRYDDAMAARKSSLWPGGGRTGIAGDKPETAGFYRAHQPYHEPAGKFVPAAPQRGSEAPRL